MQLDGLSPDRCNDHRIRFTNQNKPEPRYCKAEDPD
jgi:hypothetical protein